METEKAVTKTDLSQFLEDFWIELRKYDPIIALLAAWGVFELPSGFPAKKLVGLLLFVIQAFLAIGLTVQLGCTRDPLPEAVVIIMTVLLTTIPIEILNLLWFRVVKTGEDARHEIEGTSGCKKCCLNFIQYLGKFIGSVFGFLVFGYSLVFFILTFVGIHPGCTENEKYSKAYNVVLFQFLLTPVFMSLPYWRQQSAVLSFLGELGPVLGIAMHIRKHGFHPPPPAMANQKDNENDVELKL